MGELFPPKSRLAAKIGRFSYRRMDFGDLQGQVVRVIFHQVPCIGGQLALHMVNERGGAEKGELFVSPKADSQEMVKADKVVHVRMGDEDVANFQDFPREEGMEIAHIEKQGPPIKHEFDVNPRIAEGIMNRLWMKQGLHGQW